MKYTVQSGYQTGFNSFGAIYVLKHRKQRDGGQVTANIFYLIFDHIDNSQEHETLRP